MVTYSEDGTTTTTNSATIIAGENEICITSPNYPQAYNHGDNCHYIIKVIKKFRIFIL